VFGGTSTSRGTPRSCSAVAGAVATGGAASRRRLVAGRASGERDRQDQQGQSGEPHGGPLGLTAGSDVRPPGAVANARQAWQERLRDELGDAGTPLAGGGNDYRLLAGEPEGTQARIGLGAGVVTAAGGGGAGRGRRRRTVTGSELSGAPKRQRAGTGRPAAAIQTRSGGARKVSSRRCRRCWWLPVSRAHLCGGTGLRPADCAAPANRGLDVRTAVRASPSREHFSARVAEASVGPCLGGDFSRIGDDDRFSTV
jgi:hypothetical protein